MVESGASPWGCAKCTFINEAADDQCAMCLEPRPEPGGGAANDVRGSLRDSLRDTREGSFRLSDLDPPLVAASAGRAESRGRSGRTGRRRGDGSSTAGRASASERRSSLGKSLRLSELANNSMNNSISISHLTAHSSMGMSHSAQNSISALGHMSFAAWESDRAAWTCRACTFVNEPRFLICGACGMAEGSAEVDDELVSMGLSNMKLCDAQDFLINSVEEQLNLKQEDSLMQERATELLREECKEVERMNVLREDEIEARRLDSQGRDLTALRATLRSGHGRGSTIEKQSGQGAGAIEDKQSKKMRKARSHIEKLERIQRAERIEHENMLFTLEQWRIALQEEPDEAQEQEMLRQEAQLERLAREWEEREEQLQRLRMKVEGHRAEI